MKGKRRQQLQFRGSALWGRVNWIREYHGEKALEEFRSVLSPAGRYTLSSEIDRRGWYNYPLYIEIAIKMDEMFGKGDFTLNTEIARWVCHQATPTLYSMFIRLGSVSFVMNRATKLFRENFTEGHLKITTTKASHFAEGEIVDFPRPHLAHSHSVLGFAMGCVELSGESNVRGRVVGCRSHGSEKTVLRVEWGEEE